MIPTAHKLIQDLAAAQLLIIDADRVSIAYEWLRAYLVGASVSLPDKPPLHQLWGAKAVLGLTGNIAVGKSTVLQVLEALGAGIIDADRLVHYLRQPGMPGYQAIVSLLGESVLLADGRIDTAALSTHAFRSPALLRQLEAIFSPLVVEAVANWAQGYGGQVVVVEAIRLLEGDLKPAMDEIWVVDAPRDVQIRRLIQGRGLAPEQARKRVDAQNPQSDKLMAADVIICNVGSLIEMQRQVLNGWAGVLERLAATGWPIDPLYVRFLGQALQAAQSAFSVAQAEQALSQIARLTRREEWASLDALGGWLDVVD